MVMPVYNAAPYIEEAVLSAVYLDEVGEIIMVEDGSKDDSYDVCVKLADRFEKIKLFTHEENANKGASESRNLGIIKANFEYISFLDADDVYCPNRFEGDKNIFMSNPNIDGVYSAVGYLNEPNGKVFRVQKELPPSKLFHYLLRGTYGHFHTNGITVKKAIFDEVGYFNSKLKLHQDSEMWLRMAFLKKLVSNGKTEVGALIRRHEGNRIWKGQNYETRTIAYKAFFDWVILKNISIIDLSLLIRKIASFESKFKKKPFPIIFAKRYLAALSRKITRKNS